MNHFFNKFNILFCSFKKRLYKYYGIFQIRKNGFWYIDIPRTSSSSIKAELGKCYGITYAKTDLFEKKLSSDQIFRNHIPAMEMRKIIGAKTWNKLFTFAIVRNPWDRIVSLYHYRIHANYLSPDITFRDYILKLKQLEWGKDGIFRYYGFYYGSSDFITDEQGNIIISYVGKYENRADVLKKIEQEIGCNELGKLFIQKASPKNKHYSVYYDEETKNIVGELYKKDILLFDYKFESKE